MVERPLQLTQAPSSPAVPTPPALAPSALIRASSPPADAGQSAPSRADVHTLDGWKTGIVALGLIGVFRYLLHKDWQA